MVTAMPTMSTPLASLLQGEMDARGWSQRAMAEAAGLSNHAVVGNILRGTTTMPDIDTLTKLAAGLANETVSAATYFSRFMQALGHTIEADRADEVLQRMGSTLSEDQRQRLGKLKPGKFARAIDLILALVEDDPPPPRPRQG